MRVLHLPHFEENPYQGLLARGLDEHGVDVVFDGCQWKLVDAVNRARADAVHLHWSHPWAIGKGRLKLAAALAVLRLELGRLYRMGVPLIWTMHNLQTHQAGYEAADRAVSHFFANRASALIVHSESAASAVRAEFSTDAVDVVYHGSYQGYYENTVSAAEARQKLGIDADKTVILMFGQIRPHKGAESLIEAFRATESDRLVLVIAGSPSDDAIRRMLRDARDRDTRVMIFDRFVKDDEIQNFMNAADCVAFPYHRSLTSGALLLAMSFGKACIVPDNPMMHEVLTEKSSLVFGTGDSALQETIARTLDIPNQLAEMGQAARERSGAWTWSWVGKQTTEIYEREIARLRGYGAGSR